MNPELKIFIVYNVRIIYNYRLHFTHKRCVNFTYMKERLLIEV